MFDIHMCLCECKYTHPHAHPPITHTHIHTHMCTHSCRQLSLVERLEACVKKRKGYVRKYELDLRPGHGVSDVIGMLQREHHQHLSTLRALASSEFSPPEVNRLFQKPKELLRQQHPQSEGNDVTTELPLYFQPNDLFAMRYTLNSLYKGLHLEQMSSVKLLPRPSDLRPINVQFAEKIKIGLWVSIRQSGTLSDQKGYYTMSIIAATFNMVKSFKELYPRGKVNLLSSTGYVGSLLEGDFDILRKRSCSTFIELTGLPRNYSSWSFKVVDIKDYLNKDRDRVAVVAVTRADNLFLHPLVLERFLKLLCNVSKTRIFVRFADSVSIADGGAMMCTVQELLDCAVHFRMNQLNHINLGTMPGAMLFEIVYYQNARVFGHYFRIYEAGRNLGRI